MYKRIKKNIFFKILLSDLNQIIVEHTHDSLVTVVKGIDMGWEKRDG